MVKAPPDYYIFFTFLFTFGRGCMCVVVWFSHTSQIIYMEHLKSMYPPVLNWGSRLTTDVPSCHGLGKLIGYRAKLKMNTSYALVG